ncbi:MAG TPA: AMP-binding protein, partial [Solirubrobacter sp.]
MPDARTGLELLRGAPDDDIALWYFETPLAWGAVERLTDAFAVALASLGVAPGDRIAVQLQNMPQWLLALVGAWKAGAAVVPVNPMYTPRERAVMLEDSGARVLLVLEGLEADAGVEHVITTSPLDYLDDVPPLLAGVERKPGELDFTALLAQHGGQRPDAPPPQPADVALLTYTSGTTGPPKGAMNTHANVAFNAQTYRDWIGLTSEDVALAIAPLFHITGLVGHLAVGMLTPMPL